MKNFPIILGAALLISSCGSDSPDAIIDELRANDPGEALTNVINEVLEPDTTDSNANSESDSSGGDESGFTLTDTSWASLCTTDTTSPGASQIAVWRFTATDYVTGPFLYNNTSCLGEPLSDIVVGGPYELTGNVTTTVDGLTVHEFMQYIGVGATALNLPVQTLWLHIDGDALYVAVETEQGVEIDANTPVFYRQ